MCGRYITNTEIKEMNQIISEINKKYGEGASAAGEIFPTNNAPVFAAENNIITPVLMTWGLPQYKGKGVIINACAETVAEKQTFKPALNSRRCAIPSTGFFEWNRTADKKEKYQFNMADSPMLYMAGLYNIYENDLPRFVILTTVGNESMKGIHDRMPVLLKKDEIEEWINEPKLSVMYLKREPFELKKIIMY